MQLQISGVHMEVGESLESHVREKLESLKDKLHNQEIEASVQLHQNHHHHEAQVGLHSAGVHLHASGDGEDFYLAMDDAVGKLARQLKKHRGRLNKHQQRREKVVDHLPKLPPLQATDHKLDEAAMDDVPEDIFAEFMPKIVKKDVKTIKCMSVDEAVMQMDLLHMSFFIFQNDKTGHMNVVYRELGGTIGWVEPQQA